MVLNEASKRTIVQRRCVSACSKVATTKCGSTPRLDASKLVRHDHLSAQRGGSGGAMRERYRKVVLGLLVCAALQACAPIARQPAVPMDRTTEAVPLGVPNARYFVDGDLSGFTRDAMKSMERERATLAAAGKADAPLPPINFLAISGGGDDGAFGAGLLNGWTEAGTRPEFKAVTGISTGALIAPFAFLGSKHDKELRDVYTSVSPADIYESRSMWAAITNDAMADSRPLWNLLGKYITPEFLKEIAAEYAKGRMLLIGTTNLDARRPVVWNMGEIASSTDPRAIELVRKILIASSAVPGAFPPMMINVSVNGKQYQEMHVDGGASAQVFVYPPQIKVAQLSTAAGITR